MRRIRFGIGRIRFLMSLVGIDVGIIIKSISSFGRFLNEKRMFRRLMKDAKDPVKMGRDFWCLTDRDQQSGSVNTHYFHQDLAVAKRIFAANPSRHIDVGSRMDGFVAHVATFRHIEVVDIRPQRGDLPGIGFLEMDLMAPIPAEMLSCADSVSCLHALEHFGLGRYGDQLDPDGHLLGLENLGKILKIDGVLYLSLPFGPSRVEFNAHRVFSLDHILNLISLRFQVIRFSYVDDSGLFHDDRPWTGPEADENYGCVFGCAIFELKKISTV